MNYIAFATIAGRYRWCVEGVGYHSTTYDFELTGGEQAILLRIPGWTPDYFGDEVAFILGVYW